MKCRIDYTSEFVARVNVMSNGMYSCRAECDIDIANFLAAADKAGTNIDVRTRVVDPDDCFKSEMVFEFGSSASIDLLRAIMRECVDLHVMRQSLRPCPLGENSLERDDDID